MATGLSRSSPSDEVSTIDSVEAGAAIALKAPTPGEIEDDEQPHTTRPRLLGAGPLSSRLRWYSPPHRKYSRRELLADRIINFGGVGLSLVAVPLLLHASRSAGDSIAKQAGFLAFGAGLILMLTCSAAYHFLCWRWDLNKKLLSLDHIGISSMIMGCYVPVMQMVAAWVTLSIVLSLGAVGYLIEAYKLSTLQKAHVGMSCLDWLQIARYLVMGWACLLVFGPIWGTLPVSAAAAYLVGGIIYSVGVLAFVQKNMEYHTAIWHFAVLLASSCMYVANWLLVGLPLPE